MKCKPTICLDFDGVINDYQGWREEGYIKILDKPYPDARESIAILRTKYRIVVNSVRCTHGGIGSIKAWLQEHGIVVDDVTVGKPRADLYVDDRGYHFRSWGKMLAEIDGRMAIEDERWSKEKCDA